MSADSRGAIPEIRGTCDPRFLGVREAFAANFAEFPEAGAAVAVVVEGRLVVDLQGGTRDAARREPWEPDTLVGVASVTKGMTALAGLRLVEQGLLHLDDPVARYWPEFAAGGKERIPVRWLFSHQAGLAAIAEELPAEAIYDWERMCRALAATPPAWPPGGRQGYHAMTFGHLIGEVVRRVTGRSLGRYFAEEVAGPLGAAFHIGLPEALDSRVAFIHPDPPPRAGEETLWTLVRKGGDPVAMRAFAHPPRIAGAMNSRAWRAAEIPAANGLTTARALATIYGALVSGRAPAGGPLLGAETLAEALTEQARGPDRILPYHTRFGLGFMLTWPLDPAEAGVGIDPFGAGPRAFGHPGRGGALGYADPDARMGFGYVMNQLISGTREHPDLRAPRLMAAVDRALGAG